MLRHGSTIASVMLHTKQLMLDHTAGQQFLIPCQVSTRNKRDFCCVYETEQLQKNNSRCQFHSSLKTVIQSCKRRSLAMACVLQKCRYRERVVIDEIWIENTEILLTKIRFLKVEIGIWASKCTLKLPSSRNTQISKILFLLLGLCSLKSFVEDIQLFKREM